MENKYLKTHLLCAFMLFASTQLSGQQQVPVTTSTGGEAQSSEVLGSGELSGRVANQNTSTYLRDALVEIPSLGLSVRTDEFGYFLFNQIPAGTYLVVASYFDLNESRKEVTVTAGGAIVVDFDLTSEIYQLDTFTVKGDREGNAAALARQQSSDNIKTVAAFGGLGGDSTERATETLIRLPGMAGEVNDEGDITGIYIRGFSSDLNMVSLDGVMAPSSASMGRSAGAGGFSGAIFEEIEVVKGSTPDMPAGSISGAINIKTQNILNMKQRRRISYDLQGRWAATPLWDYIPMREDHPIHPYVNISWQEIFDVFGGQKNLGVSLGVLYRGNANGVNNIEQYYERYLDTTGPDGERIYGVEREGTPYIHDIRYRDFYNFRERMELNLKFEYRINKNHFLYFSSRISDDQEKDYTLYQLRAYTNENSGNFSSYTNDFQTIGNGTARLESVRYSFDSKGQDYKFGGKHQFGRFQLEYRAAYANSHNNLGNGPGRGGANYNIAMSNASWTVDKTGNSDKPLFSQIGGSDIHQLFDPVTGLPNYNHGNMVRRDGFRRSRTWDLAADFQYAPDLRWKTIIKVGANYRSYTFRENPKLDYWTRNKTASYDAILSGDSISYEDLVGGGLPFVDTEALVKEWDEYMASRNGVIYTDGQGQIYPWHSGVDWYKSRSNIYNDVAENFRQIRSVSEDVSALYLQATTTIGDLTILGGLRVERTDIDGFGYERTTGNSTQEDRYLRAMEEWNHPKTTHKVYSNFLPSIHFNYKISSQWKARASWSTSIGRPELVNYSPAQTINNTDRYYRLGNPDITPQKSQNLDLELSYSPSNGSLITLALFRKDLKDFIYESNMGAAGDTEHPGYPVENLGYEIRQYVNGGKAVVKGIELGYQQQSFNFLPQLFRGLGFFANVTLLDSSGNYRKDGGAGSTRELARFVDKTFNAGLNYRYKKFNARLTLNYTGDYLFTYSDNPYNLIYLESRTKVDLSVWYTLHRYATLYMNIRNIFNEPVNVRYQHRSSQTQLYSKAAPVVEFGIRGNF